MWARFQNTRLQLHNINVLLPQSSNICKETNKKCVYSSLLNPLWECRTVGALLLHLFNIHFFPIWECRTAGELVLHPFKLYSFFPLWVLLDCRSTSSTSIQIIFIFSSAGVAGLQEHYTVVLHPFNILFCIVKMASSWGILPKTWRRGVQPASQNPCPIYDQNLSFLLSYLLPDQKFDSLFMTIKGS